MKIDGTNHHTSVHLSLFFVGQAIKNNDEEEKQKGSLQGSKRERLEKEEGEIYTSSGELRQNGRDPKNSEKGEKFLSLSITPKWEEKVMKKKMDE